ncbi:PAS modulated sigma54 specific transcriptional regulator, Fis family [uncultured Desulfobacterium sp.]|uniref:PAS modulated sigma54 specific transcriptional regulator, Fis family n=1 Tax=uncultured Desulfobacterium sp. TaxID=201089 RepID=A0A445MUZ2_9BACT|nr:PAS modulated sigma54 specific transcriptional regulator, Fis family [uncultured Desulfobacterium sp.]
MIDLLECIPIAQFVIGLDHKVTHWNRACELLTGRYAKDMIGTDRQWEPFYASKRPVLADLILDQDFRHFRQLYQGKRASKSEIIPQAWEATDYFKNLGGKPRHVFFLAAPVYDQNGKVIGAIETLQDITRRVQAENELRSSEERYRVLTENIADGVIVIQDGKIIFSNRAIAEIMGYPDADDILGRRLDAMVLPDFKQIIQKMKEDFERGRSIKGVLQFQARKPSGDDIWIESHNSSIIWDERPAILTAIRDITGTKQKELAILDETEHLRRENRRLRYSIKDQQGLGRIIGKSKTMQDVYELILKAAATDNNVIIYGESGTGKELVAREIHRLSSRNQGEFVPVNSGAIPESLIEREFFGHKKGAFTGANADTQGYLDLADRGVLFLDEIGDLSLNMQVKLLRAIEDGGYMPVGSNKIKSSDFRIVAATNKDLKDMINDGRMRRDFFYRLHVIPIHLPPLRDRKDDIPLLVKHFLRSLYPDQEISEVPDEVMESFINYDWPGNVRELQNMLRRYITVGKVDFIDLAPSTQKRIGLSSDPAIKTIDLFNTVEDHEKSLIIKALNENQWHKERTASALGISRRTLFRKLKYYQLT